MYERSPQKSPQLTIPNFRSPILSDNPDALRGAKKRLQGFEMHWRLPWKTLAKLDKALQATEGGLGRLERKSFRHSLRAQARVDVDHGLHAR